MVKKAISAGDRIDAQCTKCRMLTNHTIVAMVGDKVARVECNTCGGIHNYRDAAKKKAEPKARSEKTATVPRKPRQRVASADQDFWRDNCEGEVDEGKAIVYSMNAAFKANDLVRHPTFGLGVVTAVMAPNKVEILFSDGRKLLRGVPR